MPTKIRYRRPDGTYRIRRARVMPAHPTCLMNTQDRKLHTLVESPIYLPNPPLLLSSLDEFLEAKPPAPLRVIKETHMVAEEGSFWPVSLPRNQVAIGARSIVQLSARQEGFDRLVDGTATDSYASPMRQMVMYSVLGTVGFAVLALVLMAVYVTLIDGSGSTGP